MSFSDALNEYLEMMHISSKELAEVSGVSPSTISRFRNGVRTPAADSELLYAIINALLSLGEKRGYSLDKEKLYKKLSSNLGDSEEDKEKFRNNLNSLFSSLPISIAALARDINYDASLISRIRSGKRQATDVEKLGGKIASYVVTNYRDESSKAMIADLLECEVDTLDSAEKYREKLLKWLISNEEVQEDPSMKFLKSLNDFDLNEYIKAIHFDEFKVPSVPFQLPASRTYTGLEGFKQAELDWLKATVLSKSEDPVIMYSDMPMEEMAKDMEFGKKWMYGVALILKKGLHIHQIHNLDRSFQDMMLGLESWIPLYMTGQISPYYFKNINNNVFMHFFRVSGESACSGEAISGYHSSGRYTFVKSNSDVTYYKRRGKELLSRATPLMEIYDESKSSSLEIFLSKERDRRGNRRNLLSALPFYTIDTVLLDRILERNHISEKEKETIKEHHGKHRMWIESILTHSKICDEIPVLSEEIFGQYTMSLSIPDIFYEKDICYNFEEYTEHLRMTRMYAAEHENYTIAENAHPAFNNIQISMLERKWVLISKNKAPTIHFVIRHPKLRESIEKMIVPYVERETERPRF